MPAQPRHHAAQETWSTDVLILHPGRGLDALRRLHGHGRAISLTTIFDEHYPMLCDMALRANKRMPLNATDSSRLVRDHVRQDQFSTAGCTTHHTHQNAHASSAHPQVGV